MAKDLIGYESLTDSALRGVVREALKRVQKQGLPGSHHFYLTFKTHDPGVDIPDFLKERYPDEMTIVLQNQYSGLNVTDDAFEVMLTFQKFPAQLLIPFAALTAFVDPSVQFGFQFKNAAAAKAAPASASQDSQKSSEAPTPPTILQQPDPAAARASKEPEARPENPQIVSLDKFRKK